MISSCLSFLIYLLTNCLNFTANIFRASRKLFFPKIECFLFFHVAQFLTAIKKLSVLRILLSICHGEIRDEKRFFTGSSLKSLFPLSCFERVENTAVEPVGSIYNNINKCFTSLVWQDRQQKYTQCKPWKQSDHCVGEIRKNTWKIYEKIIEN